PTSDGHLANVACPSRQRRQRWVGCYLRPNAPPVSTRGGSPPSLKEGITSGKDAGDSCSRASARGGRPCSSSRRKRASQQPRQKLCPSPPPCAVPRAPQRALPAKASTCASRSRPAPQPKAAQHRERRTSSSS